MKPVDFEESNFTFVGPEGSNILPLKAHICAEGITSCWELTDEEIEIIKSTKRVWMRVVGAMIPPMLLQVEMPFQEEVDFPEDIDGD